METKFAIIGSGRLARHLEHYFKLLEVPFCQWKRSETQAALLEALGTSTHVLLAVSDQAIAPLAEKIRALSVEEKTLVHFSGAMNVPGVFSAHPLMTFTENLQDRDWYERIPFALRENQKLAALLPGLPNPTFSVRSQDRARYHALVAMAGNFAYILWRETYAEMKKLGIEQSTLIPYLQQVLNNFANDPQSALTGPIARKDWSTIEMHLSTLNDSPKLKDLYTSFLKTTAGDMK